ncbi:MAG: hypothetical protein OXI38_13680 [Bacteroidota bacterium]|nr:hypothetical protein [Bacteroidota bacterium]
MPGFRSIAHLVWMLGMAAAAPAQSSGHMNVRLQILPSVLTVSVTSSSLDFGQQRADAGRVELDPASGLITTMAAGAHALGEVELRGPAHAAYAISIAPVTPLQRIGSDEKVDFQLHWARRASCRTAAYAAIPQARHAEGVLGTDGCTSLRFGGAIELIGVREGIYTGQVAVRIFAP